MCSGRIVSRRRRGFRKRALIVRTHEISDRVDEVAAFLGVSGDTLDRGRAHSGQARHRIDVWQTLDRSALGETAERECCDLRDEFFPGASW